MAIIVNPAGRVLELEENAEQWLKKPGFREATEDEVKEYKRKRLMSFAKANGKDELKDSIYFASVSSKGGSDGYGMSSKNLYEAVENAGVELSEYYTEQDIGFLYHSPTQITKLNTKYKILYTMFESSKIPDDWQEYLQDADLVLVPSKWCQSVFKKAGIDSKVVPLGYNDSVFKPQKRPAKRSTFTFLHYDAFNARKGHFEVLEAFEKAFKKEDKVKLIFKTTREHYLPLPPSQYPNIEVVDGNMSETQLLRLCKKADCFVFPSRGEGFGLTPLEAMATGLPAIVPNAHGISEYFDKNYMYEVKEGEKSIPVYKRLTDVGFMITADTDHLAKQMRYVYEHPKEAREMGKKAQDYVKNWTIDKTANRLKEIIDEVKSKPISDRKVSGVLPLREV